MYFVLLFVCDVAVLYTQGRPQTFSFSFLFVCLSVFQALGLQASTTLGLPFPFEIGSLYGALAGSQLCFVDQEVLEHTEIHPPPS